MKREDVYKSLDTEREYQERGKKNTSSHIVEDFNLGDAGFAMQKLLGELSNTWYSEQAPYPKSMDLIRKIGGICVAMGEKYEMPERRDIRKEASDFMDNVEQRFEKATERAAEKIDSTADRLSDKAKEFSELLKKDGLSNETINWLKKNIAGQK